MTHACALINQRHKSRAFCGEDVPPWEAMYPVGFLLHYESLWLRRKQRLCDRCAGALKLADALVRLGGTGDEVKP